MKRSHDLYPVLGILVALTVPPVAVGNNDMPGAGVRTFDITFEAAAPYYEPQTLVVPSGTPVRWVNHTASHHSVRHDACIADGPCAFESIAVPPESSFGIAPLPPGRYGYHCELHPIMRGTIVVVESHTRLEGEMSFVGER